MCNHCQKPKAKPESEAVLSHELFIRYSKPSIINDGIGKTDVLVYDYINQILYNQFGNGENLKIDDYNSKKINTIEKSNLTYYSYKAFKFDKAGKPLNLENQSEAVKPEAKPDYTLTCLEYKIDCEDCAESFFPKDLQKFDGNYYCAECLENYIICDDCGSLTDCNDSQSFDGQSFCEDCFSENVSYCEKCEDNFKNDDVSEFDGKHYCADCLNDITFRCDDCGSRFDESECFSNDNGCFCEDCYSSNNQSESEFDSKKMYLSENTFEKITSKHKFGIELEVDSNNLPYNDIEENTVFGCKHDGSLDCGSEFYSPIMQGDKGYSAIADFCENIGSEKPSRKAGFHLHINAKDFSSHSIKKIYILYRIVEKYIYKILPESRKENSYCRKSNMKIEKILAINSYNDFWQLYNSYENENGTRYFGLNLKALESHNTIELRYHSGTVDFEKIINWIKFNLALVDFALSASIVRILSIEKIIAKNDFSKFEKILDIVLKEKSVKDYILARYKKFNSSEFSELTSESLKENSFSVSE